MHASSIQCKTSYCGEGIGAKHHLLYVRQVPILRRCILLPVADRQWPESSVSGTLTNVVAPLWKTNWGQDLPYFSLRLAFWDGFHRLIQRSHEEADARPAPGRDGNALECCFSYKYNLVRNSPYFLKVNRFQYVVLESYHGSNELGD
jgi:hypothetical protein